MNFQNDIAEVLVSEKEIQAKVGKLGQRISQDYKGQELLLIGLLRGAIVFLSDLMRAISIPARLDFIGIQSYGASTESGAVRLVMDLETDIAGCHVLVVEDIVTTGGSVRKTIDHLRTRGAEVAGVAVLIDRSAGEAQFDCPFAALARLDMESWPADNCALCSQGVDVVDPDDIIL